LIISPYLVSSCSKWMQWYKPSKSNYTTKSLLHYTLQFSFRSSQPTMC